VYAALRDDIALGTSYAPSFDDAVRLTHLIGDLIAIMGSFERFLGILIAVRPGIAGLPPARTGGGTATPGGTVGEL